MPNAVTGPALLATWQALKADKSTTPRDRIVICAALRVGYVPTASAMAKMCGGTRGISTRIVEDIYARHAAEFADLMSPRAVNILVLADDERATAIGVIRAAA